MSRVRVPSAAPTSSAGPRVEALLASRVRPEYAFSALVEQDGVVGEGSALYPPPAGSSVQYAHKLSADSQ